MLEKPPAGYSHVWIHSVHEPFWILPWQRTDWNPNLPGVYVCIPQPCYHTHNCSLHALPIALHFPIVWEGGGEQGSGARRDTACVLQGLWGTAGWQLHAAERRSIQDISLTLELASAETESKGCAMRLIHLCTGRDCCSQGLIEIPARPLVQINSTMCLHPCNFPAHCWGHLGVYVWSLGDPARK